jgi:hypothetical protein
MISLNKPLLGLDSSKNKLGSFANALRQTIKVLPSPQEMFLGVYFWLIL